MIHIDGSMGEGEGQIPRTSLALALSRPTTTNIEVVQRFLDVSITTWLHEKDGVEVRVATR